MTGWPSGVSVIWSSHHPVIPSRNTAGHYTARTAGTTVVRKRPRHGHFRCSDWQGGVFLKGVLASIHTSQRERAMKILVVDIGGTNIKVKLSDQPEIHKFPSGREMSAEQMVQGVKELTKNLEYDGVTIG